MLTIPKRVDSLFYTNRLEYDNLHRRLRKKYKKSNKCEHCGTVEAKVYEWALKKGHEYSLERQDYFELCRKCHRKYDASEYLAYSTAERSKKTKGTLTRFYKRVIMTSRSGEETTFESIISANEFLNKHNSKAINQCLAGRTKTAFGYKWRYHEIQTNTTCKSFGKGKEINKPVSKIDIVSGEVINNYNNILDAAIKNNIGYSSIRNCIAGKSKSCAGYKWKYYEDYTN